MMKSVDIYTDGACSGNPGKGGWGAILIYNGVEKVIFGASPDTTNNRMELLAIIEGLRALKEPCKVNLYSDSQYALDAFNKGWISEWQKNNWRTSSKQEVKNVDLWRALLIEVSKHEICWIKVKGHSDNEYNNRCDELARKAIKSLE